MTVATVTRAFKDTSNLIEKAKARENSFIHDLKRFFYSVVTLGVGRSLLKGRSERREKEIVEVAHAILTYLPKKHGNLVDTVLHSNFDKGYQIKIRNKELLLVEGESSYSKVNGAANFDIKSSLVLKSFSYDNEFNQFKQDLEGAAKRSSYWNECENRANNAANKIIGAYRMYRVRKPEDKMTEIPAIRNDQNEIIGREIGGRRVPEPLPVPVNEKMSEGSFKTLTHRDSGREIEDVDKFIYGVKNVVKNMDPKTMSDKQKAFQAEVQKTKARLNTDSVREKLWGRNLVPQVGLSMKDPAKYEPLAMPVLEAIKDSKYFIRQTRVNERLLLSPDMGEDLKAMIEKPGSKFTFTTAAPIKNLASEIDRIHKLGIAHRDIKLANMFMPDNEIYLGDLDSMGKIGSFTNSFGTPAYFPYTDLFKVGWVLPQNCYGIAVKQDQYCFLNSMMHLYFRSIETPLCNNGKFTLSKRKEFCDVFIKDTHKQQVLNFLAEPTRNRISSLSEILK